MGTQMIEGTMCKWQQRFDRLEAEFEQLRHLLGHENDPDIIQPQEVDSRRVTLNRFQKATRRVMCLPAGFGSRGVNQEVPLVIGARNNPVLKSMPSHLSVE